MIFKFSISFVFIILFCGIIPLMFNSGYIFVFLPIIVPGFSTVLQPTFTLSPIIAPSLVKFVFMLFTLMFVLSNF